MRTFIIKPGDLIPIGRAGENQATQVRFDVTGWAETFGAGQFELIMQRPGDSELPYPVEVTVDGDYVDWIVSNVDTGIAGNCKVQLRYVVSDAVAKSVIYHGIVGESLDHIVDPPDPYDDLIERLEELARQTEQNAEAAARSAGNASDSADAAGRSAGNASDSADAAGRSANNAAQSVTDANAAKLAAQAAQQHAEAAQAESEAIEARIMDTVPDAVTDWLDEHITQETGYVIDDSLTVQGAAADAKAVGDAIAQLDKSYVTDLSFTLVPNEYVVNNTGAFAPYSGWSRTDYIDLKSVIDFTPNKLSNYSAFYDDNKTYLKDVKFAANKKVIVPDGARYLCISGTTTGMSALVVACTKNGAIKEIQNQVDSIDDFINSETTVYPTEIIAGAYINKNGYLVTGTNDFIATPFLTLPFNENQSFQIRTSIYGSAGCAIYDKNKNLLLGIDTTNMSTYGGVSTGEIQTITIPHIDGMMYARLSCRTAKYTALTDIWCKGNPLAGTFGRIVNLEENVKSLSSIIGSSLSTAKTLVIGDSISADAYGSYPKWVTNLINDGVLSANTVNSSQHATGFVARYDNQPNDFITRLKAIQNPETFDLVVVFGGINDYIQNIPMGNESGTDYTISFKPAVNEFFNYLIQNFTQARLCVLLPLRTYATWQNSVDEYQQAYGEYIKHVAKSYCIPILNLTDESGFCPYVSTFSNMWTLEVEGSHDGVHPNQEYEAKYLTPMIKAFLQTLI